MFNSANFRVSTLRIIAVNKASLLRAAARTQLADRGSYRRTQSRNIKCPNEDPVDNASRNDLRSTCYYARCPATQRQQNSHHCSDTEHCKKDIARARRYLADAPLALLMQAQWHEKQGESGRAAALYHELSAYEETARLGLRGLLQSAEKNREYDRALAIASEGIAQFPKDMALLRHTLELMLRQGELAQAEVLLDRFRTRWRMPRVERQHLEGLVLLLKAEDVEESNRPRILAQAHRLLPRHRYIALSYLEALLETRHSAFRKTLYNEWYHHPSPELTVLAQAWLSQLPEQKRSKAARKLARKAPEHLESHLLLAYDAETRGELLEARGHADEALAIRERHVGWHDAVCNDLNLSIFVNTNARMRRA